MGIWMSDALIKRGQSTEVLAYRTVSESTLKPRQAFVAFVEDDSGRSSPANVTEVPLSDWVAESRMGVTPTYKQIQAWRLDTSALSPGVHRLLISEGGNFVHTSPQFLIVTATELEAFIAQIGNEQFAVKTEIRNLKDLDLAWLDSWSSALAYSGSSERLLEVSGEHHICVAPPEIKNLVTWKPTNAKHLTIESFKFVCFHVNRFLFEQLFFGGEIWRDYHDRRGSLFVKFTIYSRKSLAKQLPQELLQILGTVSSSTLGPPELKWKRTSKDGDEGELEIRWRWD
jgi:hypothetical protein